MTETPTIRYLNTDLDLAAPVPLQSLLSELEGRGFYGWIDDTEGRGLAMLEVERNHGPAADTPESTIALMLDAIEALSEGSREIWSACTTREFNIGYDCGDEPWAFNQQITSETIRRIAACGGALRITIYPHLPDDDPRVHHAEMPDAS